MLSIRKKIVTDEAMRPIAVQIDYQDWQKIEKLLETYQLQQADSIDRFAGSIQLNEDPLQYQQRVRNEW